MFKNTSAVQQLRDTLTARGYRALRDTTVAERFQTTRDILQALTTDGQVSTMVQAVVVELIDRVEALFASVQSSTTAPTSVDANFFDKTFAELARSLQGVYDIANGDSKSGAAQQYQSNLMQQGLSLVPGVINGDDVLEDYFRRQANINGEEFDNGGPLEGPVTGLPPDDDAEDDDISPQEQQLIDTILKAAANDDNSTQTLGDSDSGDIQRFENDGGKPS